MGIFVFTFFVRLCRICRMVGRIRYICAVPFRPSNFIFTRMRKGFFLQKRFPLLLGQVIAITALLFLGSDGTERDLFRSDVLTFHGKQSISADTLPSNSFPVTLECKIAAAQQTPADRYSLILRGIDPVERALLQDALHGEWKRFDLFRAAMIAEGVRDPELIREYDARLNALVAKVLSEAPGTVTPQALTKLLFEAMHKEILTQPYSLDCTELSKVMKTGHFNCVSATVLFNCLAEKASLDVCALEMPGHALSRVKFADGLAMDLETTCPTWFDLRTDDERQMAMLQRIAPSVAPLEPPKALNAAAPTEAVAEAETEQPANPREINPVQLVATIYYNIGVDLHAKQQYPESAAANIKALYLDKSNQQAWTNLLASLNNWALELAKENGGQQYSIAALILDQGVAIDPTYENFRSNQLYVFYYWIRNLALKGRFEDARAVYAHANQPHRIPGNKSLQDLMTEINRAEENLKQQPL